MAEPIDLPAAVRAELDQALTGAVDELLTKAADFDHLDVIEANVAMTNELYALLPPPLLAAAAAGLAIRLRRTGVGPEAEPPLCRCDWLGQGTPEHVRSGLCREVEA